MTGRCDEHNMVFTLSSGEKRKIPDLDYNLFFALRALVNPNSKMKKAFCRWNSPEKLQSPLLVTCLYNNSVGLGLLPPLAEDEVVISAVYACLCSESEG